MADDAAGAPRNPFGAGEPDRRAIWAMLVERDVQAFADRDWDGVEGDFLSDCFCGIDARFDPHPGAWRLGFPTLGHYRDAWLASAERLTRLPDRAELLRGLYGATTLAPVELAGDLALAHKRFDGAVALRDGRREQLSWRTLYTCRRIAARWRIQGFVGYLPDPGSAPPD